MFRGNLSYKVSNFFSKLERANIQLDIIQSGGQCGQDILNPVQFQRYATSIQKYA